MADFTLINAPGGGPEGTLVTFAEFLSKFDPGNPFREALELIQAELPANTPGEVYCFIHADGKPEIQFRDPELVAKLNKLVEAATNRSRLR